MLARSILRRVSDSGLRTQFRTIVPAWQPVLDQIRASSSAVQVQAPTFSRDETKKTLRPFSFSRGFAADAVAESKSDEDLEPKGASALARKYPTNEIAYDDSNHERFPVGDPSKKAFTYFLLTGGRFIYASALRLLLLKFVLSMSASKDVLALASLEVDLGNIEQGQTVTVKWRGKPVFIRRRSEADIAKANEVNLKELRDPQEDALRVQNPEWLIVVGVCTHLGCVPLPNAGDYGGWFCPCHGSHYDISGRARKGPAPSNLEVPPYKFLDDSKVVIG